MEIKVKIVKNKNDVFATAIYTGKTITVLKGGKISLDFAEHIRGGRTAKNYRENLDYVDAKGNILKDCIFTSPSTAAQFVTGRSINGYVAWKVEEHKSLKEFLAEKALR